jgi:hypothetical protein
MGTEGLKIDQPLMYKLHYPVGMEPIFVIFGLQRSCDAKTCICLGSE